MKQNIDSVSDLVKGSFYEFEICILCRYILHVSVWGPIYSSWFYILKYISLCKKLAMLSKNGILRKSEHQIFRYSLPFPDNMERQIIRNLPIIINVKFFFKVLHKCQAP